MNYFFRQRLIFVVSLISYSWLGMAQECGFGPLFQQDLQHKPDLLKPLSENLPENTPDEYIIPVVVHIIHSGGADNISDAQVQTAIDVLNADFRGDTDPNHLDTKIRFRLATVDPSGCPSTGILRAYHPTSSFYINLPEYEDLSRWPIDKYLNIWVIGCIKYGLEVTCPTDVYSAGVAGLAFTPFQGNPHDGIVVRNISFGTIGTAQGNPYPHTITHEAGHYLSLQHIWGPDDPTLPYWLQCHTNSQSLEHGDFVDDTPPQTFTGFECTHQNSCHLDDPDLPDDETNFMDYKSTCMTHFTPRQLEIRMLVQLNGWRSYIWSPVNLDCAGVETLFPDKVVNITQNTDWTTGNLPNNGEITIDKIVVKAGNTLTIESGVIVHFRKCSESNLIVEPGAKLILRGKLTNSLCNPDDYWHGVEVAGTDFLHGQIFPGEIVAENGAIIENAEFGIRNRGFYSTGSHSGGGDRTGGKVTCTGTKFINNRIGVMFYTYSEWDKPSPGPWSIPEDESSFTGCLFTVTSDGVLPSLGGHLDKHIYLEGISGVKITSTRFEGTLAFDNSWENAGIGVFAVDGSVDITGDNNYNTGEFYNLKYGVQTLHALYNQPINIQKCVFDDCNVGIYNSGVSNCTVLFNDFYYYSVFGGPPFPPDDEIGIYLEGPMDMVDIQENFFADPGDYSPQNTIGICSNNLGGFTNVIRHNSFYYVTVGNVANGVNSDGQSNGLVYLCNYSADLLGAYDFALTAGASIRPFQEGPVIFGGQPSSAGNRFSYMSPYDEDDITNQGAVFTYRHGNGGLNFDPIETTPGKVVKIQTTSNNPCPQEHFLEAPPPRSEWANKFSDAKSAWQVSRQHYLASLDEGNTVGKVAMVENATSGNISSVLNTLAHASPWVSESVFKALIGKIPLVSSASIRDLLVQNPDVLENGGFWVYLENTSVFNATDMQTLRNSAGTVTTRTSLQHSLATDKASMDYWGTLYMNDYLTEYPADYNSSLYESFMQDFHDYHADALVVENMLRNGNLTQALNFSNNMGPTYCTNTSDQTYHNQYRQIIQLMVNAFLDGRTAYQLNTTELSQIMSIQQTSIGLTKSLSSNILHAYRHLIPPYAPCALPDALPDFHDHGGENRSENPVVGHDAEEIPEKIKCYPNPAGDFVQFDFSQVPAKMRCGSIVIFDLFGKMILRKDLPVDAEHIVIDTRNVPDGVYLYRIACEQEHIQSGKFIVKKG